jgi:hypothetical protein
MRIARANALPLLLLSVASCTVIPKPQPAAPPAPPPPAPAAPAPTKAADWRDEPLSPGTWVYRPLGNISEARFGSDAAAPSFTLRCDRARRQVILIRQGLATGSLAVRTSYGVRNWPVQQGMVALAATDSALDQIAFSRGRFSVSAAGLPTLFIPAWAEPSRVIEDCRS